MKWVVVSILNTLIIDRYLMKEKRILFAVVVDTRRHFMMHFDVQFVHGAWRHSQHYLDVCFLVGSAVSIAKIRDGHNMHRLLGSVLELDPMLL